MSDNPHDDKSLSILPRQPNDLAMPTASMLTQQALSVIIQMAERVGASQLVKSNSPPGSPQRIADTIFLMCYGAEIGLPPMASLRMIYVVNGTPSCSGQAMLALAHKAGIVFEFQDISTIGETATVKLKRPGDKSWRVHSYTKAMAEKAQIWGKGTWIKHPAEMMMWRAVTIALRFEAPDVLAGLYFINEIAPDIELNPETGEPLNDFIPGVATPVTHPKAATQSHATQPANNGASTSGGAGETSTHWGADKDNKQKLLDVLESYGYKGKDDILKAIKLLDPKASRISDFSIEDYPTVESFIDLIHTNFAKKSNKPTRTKPTPVDEIVMNGLMRSLYDLEPDVVLEAMNLESWLHFKSMQEARAAVAEKAREGQWSVVSDNAAYNLERHRFEFQTEVGVIFFYGHDTLREQVGDRYFENNEMQTWEQSPPNGVVPIASVVIEWKFGEDNKYMLAGDIKPLFDL